MNLKLRAPLLLALGLSTALHFGCNGTSGQANGSANGAVTGTVPGTGAGVAPLQIAGSAATTGTQKHGVLTGTATVTVEFKTGGIFTTTLASGQTTFNVPVNFTAGQDALVTITQDGAIIFQQLLLGVPASGTVDVGKVDLRSSLFVQLLRARAIANGKGGNDTSAFLRDLRTIPGTVAGNSLDIAGLLSAFQSGQLDATLTAVVNGVLNGSLGCDINTIAAGDCTDASFTAAFQSLVNTFVGLIPSHQMPTPTGGTTNNPAPPPMAANEEAATIPGHIAGTYDLTFRIGAAPFPTAQYTEGQMETFTVGTDGTLSFGTTVLTGPVLRNMNPHEAIWKDSTNSVEYALSSIVVGNSFNEINVFGAIPGDFNTFQGQFRQVKTATLTTK